MNAPLRVVGHSVPRTDAEEKVSGRALYTTDIVLPRMLHAKLLRSPRAHARIVSIDADAARGAPGVKAVLTAADIPAHVNPYYGYFIKDQPIVAIGRVRYIGDIVCAVAAESEAAACAALALVKVEYEDLPVAAGVDAALSEGACDLFPDAPMSATILYGTGASADMRPRKNVCFQFNYTTGNSADFDDCDHVFEDEFRFSRMTHYHLEPFISVAHASDTDINVWSSCQNPFPLRKELARMFKLGEHRIHVQVPYIGGGFGSKNNIKTEALTTLLSILSGRPVRLCLTMEEGFLTNTQHAAILRLRTGVMADGRLVARASEILLDAGAYSDGSPLVAEKAGYRIPGPYRWQHIDTRCLCVMTNTAPAGPFRGFGGTQATWASESQIDMIARRLGIDPYNMRVKNLLALGEPFMPGESCIDSDLKEGLDVVCAAIDYRAGKRPPSGAIRYGKGIAIGFKDGGGVNKPALARIKVSTAGDVLLLCGTTEIGQGAKTALSQIAAELLGVPLERVSYAALHTDYVPFDQGTNASSGIAVMGQAISRAAVAVKQQILELASTQLQRPVEALQLDNGAVVCDGEAHPLAPLVMRYYGGTGFEFSADGYFKAPSDHHAPLEAPCVFWEIGWGAAEVAVDVETGRIEVLQLVTSGDAGRAINPLLCKGQEDGAAMMGLAGTLFERMIYDASGRLLNADPLSYRVPLAEDLPEGFATITQEQGHGPGPFGSKGAGEGTILPVASAIANAVHDAIGVRLTALPITPVGVLDALSLEESSA